MADLTRLRTILLSPDANVSFLAAVLYHLSAKPHGPSLYDPQSVHESVIWLSKAPVGLYGDVVGATGITPADFKQIADAVPASSYPYVASLANAMAVPDSDWDRCTRNENAQSVTTHSAKAARLDAQSSAEFAAMDLLSQVGYPGVDAAVAAVSDMRNAYAKSSVRIISRQFSRSRHALSARLVVGDRVVWVLTPWCLSRQAAYAYAAVVTRDVRRAQMEQRTLERARTVMSYTARHGLQAVRDLVDPAIALLTTYNYSPPLLAFTSSNGVVRQSIQSRSPHVWVAFAAVHTRGQADVLMDLAQWRCDLAETLQSGSIPPQAEDYYQRAEEPLGGVLLFSRLLTIFREARDNGPWGSRVNKGPMLGYIARATHKKDRNTSACINRLEEVVALSAMKGFTKEKTLFVVEWGGQLNHAAVLAAAAVSKVDLCLDVAGSGMDLPGKDILDDDEDHVFSYQLYMASARSRNLPRMPTVEYPQGMPLQSKLERIYDAVGGEKSGYSVAYISGGVAGDHSLPVSVCSDSAARMTAMAQARETIPVCYYSAEFLLPKLCHHGAAADVDEYLEAQSSVDPECSLCDSHYRSVISLITAMDSAEVRLVKPRSMFAHNAHFSMEWAPGIAGVADSLSTLDACIAANVLRNHEWPTPPRERVPGADPISPDLTEAVSRLMIRAYGLLSGDDLRPMPESVAETIAASIE